MTLSLQRKRTAVLQEAWRSWEKPQRDTSVQREGGSISSEPSQHLPFGAHTFPTKLSSFGHPPNACKVD